MMQYKGYTAEVEYDAGAEVLHGRVKNVQDVITFEAHSVEELKKEFEVSVDEYLELCRELGDEPDRPYSGRFVVRLAPELHRNAAICAARQGVSLNALATRAIQNTVDRYMRPKAKHVEVNIGLTTSKATSVQRVTVPVVGPSSSFWVGESAQTMTVKNLVDQEAESTRLPC